MSIPERNAWRAFKGARTLLDSAKKTITDDDVRKRNPGSREPAVCRYNGVLHFEWVMKKVAERKRDLDDTDPYVVTRSEARRLAQRLAYYRRKKSK